MTSVPQTPDGKHIAGREACRGGFKPALVPRGSLRENCRHQLLSRSSYGSARINLIHRECQTRAGWRGTPKNASAFFGDPGLASTRTTSVVPLRGLGLGDGLLKSHLDARVGGEFAPSRRVNDSVV